MKNDLKFNWKDYISIPLHVDIHNGCKFIGIKKDNLIFDSEYYGNDIKKNINERIIPDIRDPRKLSDKEWLYILCRDNSANDYKIERKVEYNRYGMEHDIINCVRWCDSMVVDSFDITMGEFKYCNQVILDRMYSTFSNPKYDALLEKELINDAEDRYDLIIGIDNLTLDDLDI